jgi:hypothetical protein
MVCKLGGGGCERWRGVVPEMLLGWRVLSRGVAGAKKCGDEEKVWRWVPLLSPVSIQTTATGLDR